MIKIDHNFYNLNIEERKERKTKYKHLYCEKRWKHEINDDYYYCNNCYEEETDDKEKDRMLFGICKECTKPNTGSIIWCFDCNLKHLQQDFDKWTSGNEDIDELIKNRQLTAKDSHDIIEWIPYNKFTDIKYVTQGGFANVYSANWIDGYIKGWDQKTNNWKRKERRKVALKVLKNSSEDINKEFLNELETLVKLTEITSFRRKAFIIPLYGVSQDPDTKNFILVFKYIDNNFLYFYLSQDFNPLTLQVKSLCILNICMSLVVIHAYGFVHGDLHVNNILQNGLKTYISDFGLSRPVNESNGREICGVMPFIAPEVLHKKPYTEKSDIYSLGIIINTIISGKLPFDDRSHDRYLKNDICHGLRPKIRNETPQVLKDFIQKCWDENPENRPTTSEIFDHLPSGLFELPKLDLKTVNDAIPTLKLLFPKSHPQAICES